MNLSESAYILLDLMPQAAFVLDIATNGLVYANSAFKTMFAVTEGDTFQQIAMCMTHSSTREAIVSAVEQDLEGKGQSTICHVVINTAQHKSEHYDFHISYADEGKETLYIILAPSGYELTRMSHQNTYYDTIANTSYSFPFYLDVNARRMEFFDPWLESDCHMALVMENYPDPVFQYNYIFEDDVDAFLTTVERMYQGKPPEGSFRFYTLDGELVRYSVNYVVNRDAGGNPVEIVGDFIIQPEQKNIPDGREAVGAEPKQKVVLAHQIKAHFFFNTLNTISALCKQDASQAEIAIRTFATYMRSYMDLINEHELIPFQQELVLAKSTLEIERLRFPDSFTYVLDVDDLDFYVPPLTLQPIVENALLHGLRKTGRHGTLRIGAHQVGDAMEITVSDDGMGFDTSRLEQSQSIGLKNMTRRIEIMLGGTVAIQSEIGSGTCATIRIPAPLDGKD